MLEPSWNHAEKINIVVFIAQHLYITASFHASGNTILCELAPCCDMQNAVINDNDHTGHQDKK